MQTIAEVFKSVYDDTAGQITLRTVLKGVLEINPPPDNFPGTPVDDTRWIRQVSETFTGRQLEVQSTLPVVLTPASTSISLNNASRFPNRGAVTINSGGATEEVVSYENRDLDTNMLTDIGTPTYSHAIGEIVRPSVDIDFLGTFEVDLQYYPIRYNQTTVMLNGVTELREGVDFFVINEFSGNVCTRGLLRFLQAGQPTRFSSSDYLEVDYQYFEQSVSTIEIYVSFGQTALVNVFENSLFEMQFGQLQTPDRTVPNRGTITITPPLGSGILPPTPVKVSIPDTVVPLNITLAQDIGIGDVGGNIELSSIEGLPVLEQFNDATDDTQNRMVTIGVDNIYYDNVDSVTNELINVSGITTDHNICTVSGASNTTPIVITTTAVHGLITGQRVGVVDVQGNAAANGFWVVTVLTPTTFELDDSVGDGLYISGGTVSQVAEFNGAKYTRDVVKNAINITTLRSQLQAYSVDVGGYHLQIDTKILEKSFNLQPGTYNISFVGFSDTLQRGLHETVKTVTPFENKDLTFRRYSEILERQDIAENLLGATVARRISLSPGRANVPE